MGWKITSIIIKTDINHSDEKIIDSFFACKFKRVEDTTFDYCHHPKEDDLIYI